MEKYVRWYDKDPVIAQTINQLIAYPDEYQTIFADGITAFIEQECQSKPTLKSVTSLGKDKVLGLYKSKQRKRLYDKNPSLHNAMNQMYILGSQEQEHVVGQVRKLFLYVEHYFACCGSAQIQPTLGHIKMLTQAFMEKGAEETQKLLESIETELGIHEVMTLQSDENDDMQLKSIIRNR